MPSFDSCAHAVLESLRESVGDGALMWRGPGLGGSDVDIVLRDEVAEAAAAVLTAHGLRPAPGDPGHLMWSSANGGQRPFDMLLSSAWPSYYPCLERVASRAVGGVAPLPIASSGDRLLMLAAEAVAGRPLAPTLAKARSLLEEPGAGRRLEELAAEEGCPGLAELITGARGDPAGMERRGRLPYTRAIPLALRCRRARAAVLARLTARLRGLTRRPAASRRSHGGRPLLVALSGMDGSGKSTLAEALRGHLEARGHPAEYTWARLASDRHILDRIAPPIKRLLGRTGTVGDPVAASGLEAIDRVQDPREASGRRTMVSWVWILLVATLTARTHRRATRRRHDGFSVVCDRWVTDALVDLQIRYGRHGLAEAVLRALVPHPDVAILLQIAPETAARRKPGDQAPWALQRMHGLYAERAREDGLRLVDGERPLDEVVREAAGLLDRLVAEPSA
jgi:thymidylate kinase